MLDSEATSPGLVATLRRLLDSVFGALHNRAELLVVELEEEKERTVELALLVLAVLFFGIMGGLALTAGIILILPESLRAYAAFGFAVLYAIGGAWAAGGLRSRLKNRPNPFASTLDEVKKDREWLLK